MHKGCLNVVEVEQVEQVKQVKQYFPPGSSRSRRRHWRRCYLYAFTPTATDPSRHVPHPRAPLRLNVLLRARAVHKPVVTVRVSVTPFTGQTLARSEPGLDLGPAQLSGNVLVLTRVGKLTRALSHPPTHETSWITRDGLPACC